MVDGAVPLGELGRRLAAKGQMLALDPPAAERRSIAAAFAAAVTGPRAHGYGPPRDLLLGVALRLADGTVVHGGGRVVKNVAGYDLPRLVVGSEGRLGSIERVCVRLHPLPAATSTLVAEPSDPLVLEPLAPACVEYAWPPGQMLVRFESPAAAELAAEARALVGGEIVEDDEALWAEHREAAAGLHVHRVLPSAAPAAIEELRAGRSHAHRRPPGARHPPRRRGKPVPGTVFQPLEQRVVEAFGG